MKILVAGLDIHFPFLELCAISPLDIIDDFIIAYMYMAPGNQHFCPDCMFIVIWLGEKNSSGEI